MTTTIPSFISEWMQTLAPVSWEIIAPDPAATAIFSADMINGFVHEGPLASPEVHALVEPVVSLFTSAWNHGVREFVLMQDTHDPSTPEFRSYPPHCMRGTLESETIPELRDLPFASAFTVFPKNALSPAIDTGLNPWLEAHPQITTCIVVGDCTDLCTYSLAMHLRMWSNARNIAETRVIVPADAVSTFDLPGTSPGTAHPARFFHEVFLYHMAQNGIEIVSAIEEAA